MSKKNFYAVRKGRKPGIYTEWFGSNGAEVQVKGFVGAIYKGFAFRHEAEKWLTNHRPANNRVAEPQQAYITKDESSAATKSPLKEKSPQASSTKAPAESPTPADDPTRPTYTIYTDGGCSRNPGPGGYGAVILKPDGQRKELSGGYAYTTNNRMELIACIVALESLKQPGDVVLHTDSSYVVNGINKNWARSWRKSGWVTKDGEPRLNADLWTRLLDLIERRVVEFRWLKGHAGSAENERCDQLTHQARQRQYLPEDPGYE